MAEDEGYNSSVEYYVMVEEPQLSDYSLAPPYKASYNVTKAFAHLCPSGASVVNYTASDDSVVSVLACVKDGVYSAIIINNLDKEINVSLNLSDDNTGLTLTTLTDYENTANTYTLTNNVLDGIVLTPQQVIFLASDTDSPTLTLTTPTDGSEQGLLYLNSTTYNLYGCQIKFTCTNTTDNQCCGDTANTTATYDHQTAGIGSHSSEGSREATLGIISSFTTMATLAILIVIGLITFVALRLFGGKR